MDELQLFNSPEFGEIRTYIEPNGTVLFCGVDVAKILGYSNPRDAINRHCRGGVKRDVGVQTGFKADGTPSIQQMQVTFIPEGDIYRLTARSNLPTADKFERWIFDEVLPTLRRTGTYTIQKPMTQAEIIAAQSQVLVELERKALQTENRVKKIEQKLDHALDAFSSPSQDHWKEDMNEAVQKMCEENGKSPVQFRGQLYSELERAANCRLDARKSRLKTRMKKQGHTYKETLAVTKLDVISQDKQLKAIFESIVRKYQAIFCEQK
ncbi:MAG: BRO family protein [Massilioclostridium sp.]|nr:BRO family protein [Massilioclostridium sp.]